MIEENALFGKENREEFLEMYVKQIIEQKDYSFLIIDKSAPKQDRFLIARQGKYLEKMNKEITP